MIKVKIPQKISVIKKSRHTKNDKEYEKFFL